MFSVLPTRSLNRQGLKITHLKFLAKTIVVFTNVGTGARTAYSYLLSKTSLFVFTGEIILLMTLI